LERRKKNVERGDPFSNVDRASDNAAPDADAEEQFGHAMTSAVKEQIELKIRQTKRALRRIRKGKYGICENCGNMIDTDRLKVYPEATLCVNCERKRNKSKK
jgi:DnaK suppressor protein